MRNTTKYLFLSLCIWTLVSCQQSKENKMIFKVLNADRTGVDFVNTVTPTKDLNIFSYMYFYNGGGTAAGDLNKDGFIDLIFTANLGENKIYLNKGDLKFEDITQKSNFTSDTGWSNGISLVDINQDGLLDIYVSQVGNYLSLKGHNLLFVCKKIENSIPIYEEKSAEYGLNLVGFGTQAVFFDADLDGDLDFFQLNHSVHANGTFGKRDDFLDTFHPLAGDRFFENVEGKYLEKTKESGIHSSALGYGLGVGIGDVNFDGYPDLYIGNDFHENDYLYINQKNKRFKDEIGTRIKHTSRFSMGIDVADVNNDALPEIISLDMLPYDPNILKRSEGEDAYYNFKFKLQMGYNVQFARNNLQLNQGDGYFSEVGLFAGIHATDWSWSSLFLDFDNDGLKDLFISNGINKRMNDIDYINYVSNDDIQKRINDKTFDESDISLVDLLPEVKIPNKFFNNKGDVSFEESTENVENQVPSYSNGAIYADLDKDGDLDIVTNNINAPAFIYENTTQKNTNKYLQISLVGSDKNRQAIGAKVIVCQANSLQLQEKFPVRGFQSSSEIPLHFGLGKSRKIDSLLIIWPDNSYEKIIPDSSSNQLTLTYKKGLPPFDYTNWKKKSLHQIPAQDITEQVGLLVKHEENKFNEFDREALIPSMLSTAGPVFAVADINGDGLEDIFMGSAKWQKSRLYAQTQQGKFQEIPSPSLAADSTFEDTYALWLDVNGDKTLDLIVASGGNEYYGKTGWLSPRVYLNDGKGQLTKKGDAFQQIFLTASVIVPWDADNDGQPELFVGARGEAWAYGEIPTSYLLKNDGTGRFRDVTQQLAPELRKVGLVKDAKVVKLDKNNPASLLLALEWDGIVAFEPTKNKKEIKKNYLTERKGWWNFIYATDLNQDGNIDLLLGNLGKNSRLKASLDKPIRMYVDDYDENGRIEQILTYHLQDREVLFADKREIEKQLPYVKKAFTYAKDFSEADFKSILGDGKIANATLFSADFLENAWLKNDGKGSFQLEVLPAEWQHTSFHAAAQINANQWLMGGNFYDCNIQMGLYDADYGSVLQIDKNKRMTKNRIGQLQIQGQIRGIYPITIQGKKSFILAKNNDFVQVLTF
ncbi:MAG: VCBS repeat-containing protein [Spirosomataceae bacterium]